MRDKERWKIQNKLYHMKDRKLEGEMRLKELEKMKEIFFNCDLFSKRDDESLFDYILDLIKIIFLDLDKVFDFYYLKIKTAYVIMRLKKVINKLNKEIQYYEYKL